MGNNKVPGLTFLNNHPSKEDEVRLDLKHVIVDKSDWEIVVKFFKENPEQFDKMLSNTSSKDDGNQMEIRL